MHDFPNMSSASGGALPPDSHWNSVPDPAGGLLSHRSPNLPTTGKNPAGACACVYGRKIVDFSKWNNLANNPQHVKDEENLTEKIIHNLLIGPTDESCCCCCCSCCWILKRCSAANALYSIKEQKMSSV